MQNMYIKMLSFRHKFETNLTQNFLKTMKLFATYIQETNDNESEQFRVLVLYPQKKLIQEKQKTSISKKLIQEKQQIFISPSKTMKMPIDQDWPSVWPGARTFHPGSVPLPLRQGYQEKGAPPNKYANAELMKIPNFLHLTSPAIQKHCEALKQFCTKWPITLKNEEKCMKHFPIEIITSDYCYSSPIIKDPLARIVNLQVKLSSLCLDTHAKDKLLRLLGNKYNPETDIITITTDKCPTRKQNLEYAWYLFIAVYHESWRIELWEVEKSITDMEYFDWDTSQSRTNLIILYRWPILPTDYNYENIPHATKYKIAVSDLINNGEDEYLISKYKEAVKNLLNLKYNKYNKG